MRILLIIPRYSLTDKARFNYNCPLGLAYISSAIKQNGYEVDLLNLNHLDGRIHNLVSQHLDSQQYDIACTGGNALAYAVIETIITSLKTHPSHPAVILGGMIITSEPELIYDALNPDIGVIGEGEITIIEVLRALEKHDDLRDVKGILYKDAQGILVKTQPREPISDLDSIPFPDLDGIELSTQLDHMYCNEPWHSACDYPRVYSLLGSRSCPFHCTFCYHDTRYRARSIQNIVNELELNIDRFNINFITIYDECASIKKQRMYEFCEALRGLRKDTQRDIRWMCQLRVTDVDECLLDEMKRAGCDVISYGFESYSRTVLKSMKKNITPEQIDRAFNLTMRAKINVQANFIFGDVAETKETARETLDYYDKCGKGQISLGFVQPYPNSEIYQHCIEKGIISDRLGFIRHLSTNRLYNMTDTMTDEEMFELKRDILTMVSKHAVYVAPLSMRKTSKRVYSFAVECPFCSQKGVYKNCFVSNLVGYGFEVVCRHCNMRFLVLGPLQRWAYRHYSWGRWLRDMQKRLSRRMMERRV